MNTYCCTFGASNSRRQPHVARHVAGVVDDHVPLAILEPVDLAIAIALDAFDLGITIRLRLAAIEERERMAAFQRQRRHVQADEAGAAQDQDLQRPGSCGPKAGRAAEAAPAAAMDNRVRRFMGLLLHNAPGGRIGCNPVAHRLIPEQRILRLQHPVILIREIHQLRRHAAFLQRVEQLDAVIHRHAQVLLVVDDQRRRLEIAGRGVRRVLREFLGPLPEVEEALALAAVVGAGLREQVVHRGVRHQRLERMLAA